MKTLNYSRELKIKNVESLPHGTGCKFLTCIEGLNGELVAKQWSRKMPKTLGSVEVVVTFAA